MKRNQFLHPILIFILLLLLGNPVFATSVSLDCTNSSLQSKNKDLNVTELKVKGAINKNTISNILNLYPNVESLDLLNTKIVAFTDKKQIKYLDNEIPIGVFNKKTKIKRLILPKNVTRINKGAFWSCTGLETIVLPASIQVIDQFAFQLCVRLKSITFPESLISIGGASFASCESLSTIICRSKVPPKMAEWNPFPNIKLNTCLVYVPKKSISSYQSSPFFKNFRIIELK